MLRRDRVESWGKYSTSFLWNHHTDFHSGCKRCIPTRNASVPSYFTSSPTQPVICFIDLDLSDSCKMKTQWVSIWIFLLTEMEKHFLKCFALLLNPMNRFNAAYVCMSIGPLLEHGQPIRGHIIEEHWLSLTRKLSIFNSSTVKGGISRAPSPFVPRFCPAWTGLIYTVTA